MARSPSTSTLASWYESRIGASTTSDEIHGYWLFVAGVLVGVLGTVVFLVTDGATMERGIGYALAGLAPVLIMIGAIIRFPLRRAATLLAAIGGLVCVAGIGWFLVVFPDQWSTQTGHLGVIATYTLGLLIVGIAGAFVPLLTPPLHLDSSATASTPESVGAEHDDTDRVTELETQVTSLDAELAGLQASQARFEVFEDRGGKFRWRLRHRNGNIIADSAEGYSSRQKCLQGVQSVRHNALGAGTLTLEADADEGEQTPDDAAHPKIAVPSVATQVDSQATFELFEDSAGEWRWRLRHENGNIIADSGEGYASKSNAHRSIARIREHVSAAPYLDIDPVAYELYQDTSGDHRWRLIHANGNILADSGEGYSSRSAARNGVERVRGTIADAELGEQQ